MRNTQRENIEYRIMPPGTEYDSTFHRSLKEISGINDRPLLRTDQKHARTKTVLGGAGQSSMFAPSKQPRKQECSICPHLPHSIVNAIGTVHLLIFT